MTFLGKEESPAGVRPNRENVRVASAKNSSRHDAVELMHFERLKSALSELPKLSHPRLDKPVTLQTDASKRAIGSVLLQRQPDGLSSKLPFFLESWTPPNKTIALISASA